MTDPYDSQTLLLGEVQDQIPWTPACPEKVALIEARLRELGDERIKRLNEQLYKLQRR